MSTKKRVGKAKRSKNTNTRTVIYKSPPRARAPKIVKEKDTFLGMEKPNSLGANIGSFLGHGAQQLIKTLTGFGDYHLDKNSIVEGGMTPPQIVNAVNRGGFIVRHREYIADVTATTAFTNTSYDINPGLNGSFPYLAQIAKAFELYRLRGLVYEFKSTSSDAVLSSAASSALGVVAMATQYNSLNPGFTNLIAMENHEFSCASKPSCDFYHPVECKKSLIPNSELYVRTGAVPSGGDIRLFDIGQFNIATSGMQNATGIIGQLWCTYEVEFYQARYDAPTSIKSDHVQNTSCTQTAWCGSSHTFATNSSLGCSVGSNTITFPSDARDGKFMVMMKYALTGGAGAVTNPAIAATSGCGFDQIWCDSTGFDASTSGSNNSNASIDVYIVAFILTITAASAVVTFSGGTLPSSNMDLFITQFDSDIST